MEEQTKALEESEKRYAMTLAAVNDGLWDWHVPSGNAFFSTRYYKLLGYDGGEFPATYASWRLLVHPDDIARAEHDIKKSIEIGKGFAIDLRMREKTGDWRWVSTRGKAIELDTDGKALRMVGTLSDITERKRMEVEKAKLEEQNRQLKKAESLGLMSGSIAHIFNNQLQIVLGYLELVIGELPQNDSRASKLEKSMQAAKKASEVSGNLLAYLGQKQVKLKSLELAELCRMSLPGIEVGKPENVILETDLPSPGPCIS
ncbi:MAG: PAS domain-containing protein, partial [Lentisphaerae bacterium]|nr:PAS domain-containing protein [Lentisphaerota bacterium]